MISQAAENAVAGYTQPVGL